MPAIESVEKGGTNDVQLQPWNEPSEKAPPVAIRPSFMSIFDRRMCYPFFIKLCEHLSIAEIVALTRTCKKYADLYQYLLPIRWDVNRMLRRFVPNPCGFRSQMAKSNAFIAGSFVVQFFERTSWKPFDLDIFIEHGERAETFQRSIKKATSSLTPVLILTKSGSHAQTRHEERECTIGPPVPRIRLVTTLDQPIQSILKSCFSTVAVNLISWNKAYSIFPLSTFVQSKGYKLAGGRYQVARSKLSCSSLTGGSFRMGNPLGLIRLKEHHINHPIRKFRRVGDKFTWTILFDTKNVQWSEIPDQVLEYQSFKMAARIGGGYGINEPIACHIGAIRVMDETQSYRFLCSMDFFRFLHQHSKYSIMRDPHDSNLCARLFVHGTMANCEGTSLNCVGDSEKPKSRKFREADFPDWYRKWERLVGGENGFPEFQGKFIDELGPPE